MTQAADLKPSYRSHLEELDRRWDQALNDQAIGEVAIYAGAEAYYFEDDRPHVFQVNPHFKAWLPLLDAPDCWLLKRVGERARLVFVQPRDYWHQPPGNPDPLWADEFEITIVHTPEQARDQLGQTEHVSMIGPANAFTGSLNFASINPQPLLDHLNFDRAFKTTYEIQCMEQASLLGCRGHKAAADAFRAGKSEYGIHLDYCEATGLTESQLPYGSIVALNQHGAVLHYQHLDGHTDGIARSFLIDAGASFHGYASDITRTYARQPGRFQDLIDSMESAQLRLVDGARAGVDYRDLHITAHHEIAQVLNSHGIVDLAPEDIVATGISSVFLPHGLGHLLGLQVHDVGGMLAGRQGQLVERPEGHPFLRMTRALGANMTLTIEPGLYFIDMLLQELKEGPHHRHVNWDLIEELKPYGGVRIEDNVMVTDQGAPVNLTRNAFAKLN